MKLFILLVSFTLITHHIIHMEFNESRNNLQKFYCASCHICLILDGVSLLSLPFLPSSGQCRRGRSGGRGYSFSVLILIHPSLQIKTDKKTSLQKAVLQQFI